MTSMMSMTSKAQIVATIGPASNTREVIKKILERGVDVMRLNFSWGTHGEHAENISMIREAAQELGKRVPIIQDLSGPRIQKASGHEFDESAQSVFTEKDLADLKFGISHGVDYIAMSFISRADDVLKLKGEIKKLGASTPVIAKIERKVALDNLDEIIEVSDAIMIARGDLGNDVALEKIPFIEKTIVEKCKKAGKPVITATQMLLSMTSSNTPTRAEVTDVAYAIISGSDAVMLSEESASGKYPVEAVAMMEKIVAEAEKHMQNKSKFNVLK